MQTLESTSLELLDALSERFDDAQRWQCITGKLTQIGFNGLNIVCFSPASAEIHWARCHMKADWLDEYTQKSYAEEDEVLAQVFDGTESRFLNTGQSRNAADFSPLKRALHKGLYDAGYRYLYSLIVPCPDNEAKLVVLTSELHELGDEMAQNDRAMRILSTVIATNLGPETDSIHGRIRDMTDVANTRPDLTQRELEVLSLLGTGLRNDTIAHQLDLSEITIRTHLRSARSKLGAPTREAALVRAVQMGLVKIPHHRNR